MSYARSNLSLPHLSPAADKKRYANIKGIRDYINTYLKRNKTMWWRGTYINQVLELFKNIREHTMRHINPEFCIEVLEFCASELADEDLARVQTHLALAYHTRYQQSRDDNLLTAEYYLGVAASYCDSVLKKYFYKDSIDKIPKSTEILKHKPESVLRIIAFALYVRALTEIASNQLEAATESTRRAAEMYSYQQIPYDPIWARAWALYGNLLSLQNNPKHDPKFIFDEVIMRFMSSKHYKNSFSKALILEMMADHYATKINHNPNYSFKESKNEDTLANRVQEYYERAALILVKDNEMYSDTRALYQHLFRLTSKISNLYSKCYRVFNDHQRIQDGATHPGEEIALVEDMPQPLHSTPYTEQIDTSSDAWAELQDDIEYDEVADKPYQQEEKYNPVAEEEFVTIPLDSEEEKKEAPVETKKVNKNKVFYNTIDLVALNIFSTRYGSLNAAHVKFRKEYTYEPPTEQSTATEAPKQKSPSKRV